ncbi:MAG: hypothetical protein J0H05_14890, partial [Stenotrophomonas acidaminiphila]|nr:hypothetical protein [Stenotrophomonas acidaminiphila]
GGGSKDYAQIKAMALNEPAALHQLLRETGQTGGRAQLRRELFLQQDEARHAFEKARDAQIKRGFQVVFASGEPHP